MRLETPAEVRRQLKQQFRDRLRRGWGESYRIMGYDWGYQGPMTTLVCMTVVGNFVYINGEKARIVEVDEEKLRELLKPLNVSMSAECAKP